MRVIGGEKMPHISVKVKSAQRSMEFGRSLFGPPLLWRFGMTFELNRWEEELRLSTGENIDHVNKYVSFKTIDGSLREWLDEKHGGEGVSPIGLLHYLPGRERKIDSETTLPSLSFEVYLTEAQMELMLNLAREGRWPETFGFDLADDKGMKYGWEPDGSGKDWDTSMFPRIPIEGLQFQIPILDAPSKEEAPVPNTPTTPVGADLLPVLNKIAVSLGWVGAGVAMLVGLAIFRH